MAETTPVSAAVPLTDGEITDTVLGGLGTPRSGFWISLALIFLGALSLLWLWVYQTHTGMKVTGLSIPVGWAVYITNFVFWVGIGHAGTLVSAILHLVRSRWRTAVSRAAEAMTVFAVLTAALFPLIHLGRMWVFYFIIPYPTQRQIWPNFISPLVWDVCAVLTYLTVSIIFWYMGLVPDLAAARDRFTLSHGPDNPRTRFYRKASLGWQGSGNQWHHYGRGYLFFAALATPLVISVHSVVSWDFAMSNLPGWHTTIFAPYFVAGAIHSGLAMVLTLLIPMRHILKLHKVIDIDHFEAVAQTILVTAIIVGYAYVIEPFMSWYSGDVFEKQFAVWRATGWMAPHFWALPLLNVLVPLAFLYKPWRRNLVVLFVVSILINVGMWLERLVIIAGSLSHDFLPHNWRAYSPSWVEIGITLGAFCFFMFWFLVFTKSAPTVSIVDVKENQSEGPRRYIELDTKEERTGRIGHASPGLLAVFSDPEKLLAALQRVKSSGAPAKGEAAVVRRFTNIETFTPVRLLKAEQILGRGPSPVRRWTLAGAIGGCIGGFWLAIGTALVNSLIVGGKAPVSIYPYCIVGFEGTILIGSLFNLGAILAYGRIGRSRLHPAYDPRFSRDRYGLFVACDEGTQFEQARALLEEEHPEEIHVIGR